MKLMWGLLGVFLLAAPAWADRTPSVRAEGQRHHGTRTDITVPYLATGSQAFVAIDLSKLSAAAAAEVITAKATAFGAYKVSPRIYTTPSADDLANPAARPAYNLPFYGARMGFGSGFNGAIPKPTLLPSQAK